MAMKLLSCARFSQKFVRYSSSKAPKVLITGALGQLGSELTRFIHAKYGIDSVISTDIRVPPVDSPVNKGKFMYADVKDFHHLESIVVDHRVTWVIHLSALLSFAAEKNPQTAIEVNNIGTQNILELAKAHRLRVFSPSTIGAFGPSTPRDNTPDLTIMRPTTIYGITKIYMELMGEYYHRKHGVDFRSLRLPGIISAEAPPGGGTTDYAVDIFHHALDNPNKPYPCYLRADSTLPMMLLSDCLSGIMKLIEADNSALTQRTYNMQAISFDPAQLTSAIRKVVPTFSSEYSPDPIRQAIADSWPKSMDDSAARRDWGWKHEYDTDALVNFMIKRLREIKGKH